MNMPELFSKTPMETIPEEPQNSEDTEGRDTENVDQKRTTLIRLSESGEISQSVKCIRKASNKVVVKLYNEYEEKQADDTNTFLADTLISNFAYLINALELVEEEDSLSNALRKDVLLQKNIKNALSFVAPFIPFAGIITGGATLGKHIMKKRNNTSAKVVDVTDVPKE